MLTALNMLEETPSKIYPISFSKDAPVESVERWLGLKICESKRRELAEDVYEQVPWVGQSWPSPGRKTLVFFSLSAFETAASLRPDRHCNRNAFHRAEECPSCIGDSVWDEPPRCKPFSETGESGVKNPTERVAGSGDGHES
jgi:hypothetical protein